MEQSPSSSPAVALFVTCMVDQLMPEIGIATVKLLRRAGIAVDFPAAQTCCGQPFFNSGFRKEAARLVKKTIETLEPYPAVVIPGGSCTTMIRVDYLHLLADSPEWVERARRLAAKTFELSEYLVHQAKWQPTPAPEAPRVTYHDSCHMNRTLHLKTEPRHLLASAGCRLVEMREPDRCCGFGGLFSVHLPEVSNEMTREKLRQAQDTEAALVVTADPGCLLQMRGISGNHSLRIEHLATVLEEVTR